MVESDAVVIGGGMSGLMAAAVLARRGRRVVLAEATDRIGGYQCRLAHDGLQIEPHFHFLQDAGPGRPVRLLLDELGIELEWRRVAPLVDLHFPDHRETIPADRGEFIDGLKARFPWEARGIDRLFATTQAIYRAAQDLPRPRPALVRHAGDTVDDLVGRCVRDPLLRAIAGGWAAYFGYGAASISGVAIAIFSESCFDGGVLQPAGGIDALARALREVIERHGGRVLVSTAVGRVLVSERGVAGVALDSGEELHAPVVVSSADATTTLGVLVDDDRARSAASRFARLDQFRSPFTACVELRDARPGAIGGSPVKVVFPSLDTAEQDRAQLRGEVERAPVSIGVPTVLNPELAPAGTDIALLYTFVTRAQIGALLSDEGAATAFARRLVATADRGLPGLAERVVSLVPSTTAVPEIYNEATAGALGWAPTPGVLLGSAGAARLLRTPVGSALAGAAASVAPRALERLADQAPIPGTTTSVPGLFLCGQWTRTGPGMNNVLVSGAAAAAAACAA